MTATASKAGQLRCHVTHRLPRNGFLSKTATFLCPQGARCGEIGSYTRRDILLSRHATVNITRS